MHTPSTNQAVDSRQIPIAAVRAVVYLLIPSLWVLAIVGFWRWGGTGEIISGLLFALLLFALAVTFFIVMPMRWVLSKIGDSRRRSAQMMLEYLEQTIRLNLPLPAMLKAGRGEEGWLGRKLRGVGLSLEGGASLDDALRDNETALPPRTLAMIGVAERMGQLPAVLSWVITRERRMAAMRSLRRPAPGAYLALFLVVGSVLVTGITILILPKFEQIFQDHDESLPAVTRVTFDVLFWLVGRGHPEQMIPGVFWLLPVVMLWYMSRQPWGRHVMDRVVDPLPFVGRLLRDRQLGEVCFIIAQGMRAGLPLHVAVREAGDLDLSPVMRKRIWRWANLLEEGHAPSQAALQARLPLLMVNMLAGIETSVSGPATFDFLATYYANSCGRVMLVMQNVSGPLVVMAMGLMVGIFVYALIAPLVALIWNGIHHSGAY